MNIGGVEIAILRSTSSLNELFDYKIYCVKSRGSLEVGQLKLRDYLKSLCRLSTKPDIVITSLWWSHPIGMISVFFGVKWVIFLHSSGFSSFPDWLFTQIALIFGKNFFYDSHRTSATMLNKKSVSSYFIPCFTLETRAEKTFQEETDLDVIWVGRNSPEKRLDLVTDVVRKLILTRPTTKIKLCIAGSNYPEFDKLQSENPLLIDLCYNASPDSVLKIFQESKIALCLSDYEGFSMSTAEAAISANLIAARGVGDLHIYLPEKETIWLHKLDEYGLNLFVKEICSLLDNKSILNKLRKHTMEFSSNKLENFAYQPAFYNAIKDLTGKKKNK